MLEFILLFSLVISFLITLIVIPIWIKMTYARGLVGKDMHKPDKRKIAEGGGIAVLVGFSVGVLFYVILSAFYLGEVSKLIYVFALFSVLLMTSIIGVVDDLMEWKKGLSKKVRILAVSLATIPLIVVNMGNSTMNLPLLGVVDFGFFYPLFLIPLGIVGAATTYNFLGGLNGLEASQGIIILSFLSYVSYITGTEWLALIGMIIVFSLLAFYIFNKYPAKVFPGDSLTLPIGALIAAMAILGNFEKIAVFIFAPYIIETSLKVRGKLAKESFTKLKKDGSLDLPYGKIYSLTHLSVYLLKKFKPSGKAYEKEVVYLINGFQILIIVLAVLIFM